MLACCVPVKQRSNDRPDRNLFVKIKRSEALLTLCRALFRVFGYSNFRDGENGAGKPLSNSK